MPSITLIEPTTAAVTTTVFHAIQGEDVPATLIVQGLAGAEEVDIVISVDNGATSATAFQDGAAIVLTATDNTLAINSAMRIGVLKDATLAATGVFISFRTRV